MEYSEDETPRQAIQNFLSEKVPISKTPYPTFVELKKQNVKNYSRRKSSLNRETPRTLLDKVLKEKVNRNSSVLDTVNLERNKENEPHSRRSRKKDMLSNVASSSEASDVDVSAEDNNLFASPPKKLKKRMPKKTEKRQRNIPARDSIERELQLTESESSDNNVQSLSATAMASVEPQEDATQEVKAVAGAQQKSHVRQRESNIQKRLARSWFSSSESELSGVEEDPKQGKRLPPGKTGLSKTFHEKPASTSLNATFSKISSSFSENVDDNVKKMQQAVSDTHKPSPLRKFLKPLMDESSHTRSSTPKPRDADVSGKPKSIRMQSVKEKSQGSVSESFKSVSTSDSDSLSGAEDGEEVISSSQNKKAPKTKSSRSSLAGVSHERRKTGEGSERIPSMHASHHTSAEDLKARTKRVSNSSFHSRKGYSFHKENDLDVPPGNQQSTNQAAPDIRAQRSIRMSAENRESFGTFMSPSTPSDEEMIDQPKHVGHVSKTAAETSNVRSSDMGKGGNVTGDSDKRRAVGEYYKHKSSASAHHSGVHEDSIGPEIEPLASRVASRYSAAATGEVAGSVTASSTKRRQEQSSSWQTVEDDSRPLSSSSRHKRRQSASRTPEVQSRKRSSMVESLVGDGSNQRTDAKRSIHAGQELLHEKGQADRPDHTDEGLGEQEPGPSVRRKSMANHSRKKSHTPGASFSTKFHVDIQHKRICSSPMHEGASPDLSQMSLGISAIRETEQIPRIEKDKSAAAAQPKTGLSAAEDEQRTQNAKRGRKSQSSKKSEASVSKADKSKPSAERATPAEVDDRPTAPEKQRKARRKPTYPALPMSMTRSIIQHYAGMNVHSSAIPLLEECCHVFWKKTITTLTAYAEHAGRNRLEKSDVELYLYRLRLARDRNSMNALIEKYLPLEMRSEVIPMAIAGNKVIP